MMELHPKYHWDFVQIQMNYLDWTHAGGRNTNADHMYEQLAARDIPVVIMEPLRGGGLASLTKSQTALLKEREPDRSVASWAFRFVGSFPKVLTALSGMTYREHLEDNLRTFCINLQNALAGISGNTAISCQYVGPHDYDPVDVGSGQYDGNDGVMIINARFTDNAWNDVTMTIGGVTLSLSRSIGRDIPADSTNFRQNGGQQYWGGCNFYRFYDYYSTNGRTLDNPPTSPIDTDSPVKEQVFNESANAAIYRNAYGTYKNYLRSCMVQWPTNKGANGKYFDKGHEFTKKLARAQYISMASGSPVVTYLYGPAHYCGVEVSANAIGLEAGSWWLPSSGEMIELMQDITYGTSEYSTNGNLDPVNVAIYRLNDNTFDTSKGFRFAALSTGSYSRWTSTMFSLQFAYYFNGRIDDCISSSQLFWPSSSWPITTVNIPQ